MDASNWLACGLGEGGITGRASRFIASRPSAQLAAMSPYVSSPPNLENPTTPAKQRGPSQRTRVHRRHLKFPRFGNGDGLVQPYVPTLVGAGVL